MKKHKLTLSFKRNSTFPFGGLIVSVTTDIGKEAMIVKITKVGFLFMDVAIIHIIANKKNREEVGETYELSFSSRYRKGDKIKSFIKRIK